MTVEECCGVILAYRFEVRIVISRFLKRTFFEDYDEKENSKVEDIYLRSQISLLASIIDSSYFRSQVLRGASPLIANSLLKWECMPKIYQSETIIIRNHNVVWLKIEMSLASKIVELHYCFYNLFAEVLLRRNGKLVTDLDSFQQQVEQCTVLADWKN